MLERDEVLACKACVNNPLTRPDALFTSAVFVDPRFGTGCTQRPQLMVVGQNPPREPERRLHGAWMLHYSLEKFGHVMSRVELLVRALVYNHLGYKANEVYATQAVKCATHFNKPPVRSVTHACAKLYLSREFEIKPRFVLAFGVEARDAVNHFGVWPDRPDEYSPEAGLGTSLNYKTFQVLKNHDEKGIPLYGSVETTLNRIYAPHPSYALRFLDTDSWIRGIVDARNYLLSLENKS